MVADLEDIPVLIFVHNGLPFKIHSHSARSYKFLFLYKLLRTQCGGMWTILWVTSSYLVPTKWAGPGWLAKDHLLYHICDYQLHKDVVSLLRFLLGSTMHNFYHNSFIKWDIGGRSMSRYEFIIKSLLAQVVPFYVTSVLLFFYLLLNHLPYQ